jgi:hypothetical protein
MQTASHKVNPEESSPTPELERSASCVGLGAWDAGQDGASTENKMFSISAILG